MKEIEFLNKLITMQIISQLRDWQLLFCHLNVNPYKNIGVSGSQLITILSLITRLTLFMFYYIWKTFIKISTLN